tara:strand:+ start:119 stop:430 length:312 start_codon:yes stop_codon:yes gene_type:complete
MMGENIVFLSKENQINKVIRDQRKSKEKIRVLFTSLWDDWSKDILSHLIDYRKKAKLYVVNSFTMPHSFVIFRTTKVPYLVTLKEDNVYREGYLPNIYRELGC